MYLIIWIQITLFINKEKIVIQKLVLIFTSFPVYLLFILASVIETELAFLFKMIGNGVNLKYKT